MDVGLAGTGDSPGVMPRPGSGAQIAAGHLLPDKTVAADGG